ncbi:MAG: hypothetical protein ACJ74O_01545 [Frankiaceae bacterium]
MAHFQFTDEESGDSLVLSDPPSVSEPGVVAWLHCAGLTDPDGFGFDLTAGDARDLGEALIRLADRYWPDDE